MSWYIHLWHPVPVDQNLHANPKGTSLSVCVFLASSIETDMLVVKMNMVVHFRIVHFIEARILSTQMHTLDIQNTRTGLEAIYKEKWDKIEL